ncbi:MAG: PDDEXK nuclease domain-containing protein [bacterium]
MMKKTPGTSPDSTARTGARRPGSKPARGGYSRLLVEVKEQVRGARTRAGLAVNRELVLLYWQVGRSILAAQRRKGWNAKEIDRLARDLGQAFPEMRGFSGRNLKAMRAFAQAWPEEATVQDAPAQVTWYHNIVLLDKLKEPEVRLWYAESAARNGWSRDVLVHQIESDLYSRRGMFQADPGRTKTGAEPALAEQLFRDPYDLDLLGLGREVAERERERGPLEHLEEFLLGLGVGLASLGRQFRLRVGGQDFFIDLLLYHLRLRRHVVVELKLEDFKPAYARRMGFYLAAIDTILRAPLDETPVGIILCKTSKRISVEYAQRTDSDTTAVQTRPIAPPAVRKELPKPEVLRRALAAVK